MNKFASLLAVALLLASSIARAEEVRSDDLRYCLDLPTVQEIAKCSGEISPGSKGRTYSREEVEKILSVTEAIAPASTSDSSGTPATASDEPNKDLSPKKAEGSSN